MCRGYENCGRSDGKLQSSAPRLYIYFAVIFYVITINYVHELSD